MKKVYTIFLTILGIAALAWFLPWLYGLSFPIGGSEPFVSFSPLNNKFVVSENADDDIDIYTVDAAGRRDGERYSKERRDSLLPQVYFTQLMARNALPDSIAGKEVSLPILKQGQWAFSVMPREINKNTAEVYPIMEAMPQRFELEDPDEVFRIDDGVEFIRMADNSIDTARSQRFSRIFDDRGFVYPLKAYSANITTRKAYDEGYLLVDALGDIYHMKMQAGRPYMVKIRKNDSIKADHVFIFENTDRRHLGLVCAGGCLYAIEHEDYSLTKIPVAGFDPKKNKILIFKNIFNWVIKITGADGIQWTALDSDSLELLGRYELTYDETWQTVVKSYIFPFELTFTALNDSYVYPRVTDVSLRALWLNIVLSLSMALLLLKQHYSKRSTISCCLLTVIFGIYYFIVRLLLSDTNK